VQVNTTGRIAVRCAFADPGQPVLSSFHRDGKIYNRHSPIEGRCDSVRIGARLDAVFCNAFAPRQTRLHKAVILTALF